MTFIERPPPDTVTFCSVSNSIFHCFVLTVLNGRCKLTIRLALKLFCHNAQYHIVIKEYINEYLNVERKLQLELITCFFLNPSLGSSTRDFAHTRDLFRDGEGSP